MSGRATALGPHDIFLIDQWGLQLFEAFGEMPYLVGSVARAEDAWRDVDLRMLDPLLLDDNPLARRTLNVALTLWGRHVTGLPIDFQFQPADEFHSYDGELRNPMGTRTRTKWRGQSLSEGDAGETGRPVVEAVSPSESDSAQPTEGSQ